ncbi:MAG: YiiD C-terminal domain-containing protein [Pseudomonadota bacterium]
MDVTKIPFIRKIGIGKADDGRLVLSSDSTNQNHINTLHASAQFALAETSSAEALQTLFPDLEGKVVPVLRDSQVKYRKPTVHSVSAFASVEDAAREKFIAQFERKGRAAIAVSVDVVDAEDVVTCTGVFNWFVQSL